jgi:hypothetical protein
MDEISTFSKQLIFDYLTSQLRHKETRFSETGKYYIEMVGEFFEEFKEGISSILNPGEKYSGNENWREITEAVLGRKYPTRNDLKCGIIKAGKIKKQLEKMVQEPEKFYRTKDSQELFEIGKRLREIYNSKKI